MDKCHKMPYFEPCKKTGPCQNIIDTSNIVNIWGGQKIVKESFLAQSNLKNDDDQHKKDQPMML